MHSISSVHSALARLAVSTGNAVGDRGDGFGPGHGRGRGFFMFPLLGLLLLVVLGVVLVVGARRDWFGSRSRQQRQFDEWHRLAHAGPVPTGPSVMPVPPAAVVPPAPAPATAPAPAPSDAPAASDLPGPTDIGPTEPGAAAGSDPAG